jgi:hypothetical protein
MSRSTAIIAAKIRSMSAALHHVHTSTVDVAYEEAGAMRGSPWNWRAKRNRAAAPAHVNPPLAVAANPAMYLIALKPPLPRVG